MSARYKKKIKPLLAKEDIHEIDRSGIQVVESQLCLGGGGVSNPYFLRGGLDRTTEIKKICGYSIDSRRGICSVFGC